MMRVFPLLKHDQCGNGIEQFGVTKLLIDPLE